MIADRAFPGTVCKFGTAVAASPEQGTARVDEAGDESGEGNEMREWRHFGEEVSK